MHTIPLFPLNSVLFPKGRIALQIFESRYMDMMRQCLKEQSGFGIVLIARGSEVEKKGQELRLHRVGTYGEMVDWNQLPNGLLGITVEGRKTFEIIQSWKERNALHRADVTFREYDGVNAEPVEVGGQFTDYVTLLRGLAQHPLVQEMNLDIGFENLREIAWRLSELLPISNKEKQALLESHDTFDRLDRIDLHIKAMNQQETSRG